MLKSDVLVNILGQLATASTEACSLGTAPLTNSWIITIIWLYIALNRTPNIDCYCRAGQYPTCSLIQEARDPKMLSL